MCGCYIKHTSFFNAELSTWSNCPYCLPPTSAGQAGIYSKAGAIKYYKKEKLLPRQMNVVVCCCKPFCCKLNNTLDCDEHLFGQVSTCTGRYCSGFTLPITQFSPFHSHSRNLFVLYFVYTWKVGQVSSHSRVV